MGLFEYEVIDKAGVMSSGKIEGEHEPGVMAKLRAMGYVIVDIRRAREKQSLKLSFGDKKVTVGDLSLFSRQLAAMIDAGIPLTKALFTLSRQVSNETLAKALTKIAEDVEGGMAFGEAIATHPKIFNGLYVNMVKAGEVGGTLERTLAYIADQLQKDKVLADNIRSATFYPTMVMGFAFVIMTLMMFFIVPVFMNMFPPGIVLPLPTRIIIFASDMLRSYWYIWLVLLMAIILGMRAFFRGEAGRNLWDRVRFKIPVFGELIHKSVVARFSRTLSTLIAGGIPVVQALETTGPAVGSNLIARAVEEACRRIHEGQGIAQPLKDSNLFPPMVIHMISVGEETGQLPGLLARIAEFYEEEVATMTKGLTALLEPLMLVFVGVTVGGMIVSLYLPIFTVVTQSGF